MRHSGLRALLFSELDLDAVVHHVALMVELEGKKGGGFVVIDGNLQEAGGVEAAELGAFAHVVVVGA